MRVRASVFSVLLVSFSACGLGGGGDAGLVPALLGLSPPPTAGSGEAAGTAETASRSGTTEPARSPSAIAPKQSSPSAPEQQQIVAPAFELRRDPNEPSADEKLRVIRRLRDRHLITDAEYESRRALILESN